MRKYYNLYIPLMVGIGAFAVYAITSCRTIAWWDCPRYTLAAYELGIPPAPGSLLLTLIGWFTTKIPVIHPIVFRLNLLACLLAALTAGITAGLVITLSDSCTKKSVKVIGAAIAGLALAFSLTIWNYAVQFTPYILTTVFTGLILLALFQWWEKANRPGAWRWLLLIFLLFGLDFSVHRTNALLLPGVLVWIGLRDVRTYRSFRAYLCIAGGLAAGLSFHLLLMAMASRSPFLNFGNPNTMKGFWNYISLQQYGGSFLFDIFHRKASLINVQLVQYLKIFALNFAVPSRWVVTLLPVLIGVFGLIAQFRNEQKQALGLMTLFLMASLGGVIYYNVPQDFIRPVDRHYMPSLVIFALWIGYGAISIISLAGRLKSNFGKIAAALAAVTMLLSPVGLALNNRKLVDLSRSNFAGDFARNLLDGLPKDAILFTNGDNDTFPLWCLQKVEGVRTDVDVININLLNADWYLKQIARNHPSVPFAIVDEDIDRLMPFRLRDTVLILSGTNGVNDTTGIIAFPVTDTADQHLWKINSQAIWQIIGDNQWRRPVCFAVTLDFNDVYLLNKYLRFEGLHYRLMSQKNPPVDTAIVRRNMIELGQYSGINDPSIVMYADSKMMAGNYAVGLILLAQEQQQRSDAPGCRETVSFLDEHLPLDRLGMLPDFKSQMDSLRSFTNNIYIKTRGTNK